MQIQIDNNQELQRPDHIHPPIAERDPAIGAIPRFG
jgi:hypothetical protein